MKQTQKGFSLVELAIVLTIIGLIVGGIMVGQDLLRASEVNSIITDVEKVRTAFRSFEQKYAAIPGDMTDATDYWGTNPNCATGGQGSGTQTCNGNGDGMVTSVLASATNSLETFVAWQHLGLSGFYPGNYTGAYTSTVNHFDCDADVSCPSGTVSGAVISLGNYWYGGNGGTNGWWWADYVKDTKLIYGADGSGYKGYPLLTATEAFGVDSKVDDGLPAWGKWRSFGGPGAYTGACAVDSSDGGALANSEGTKALAQTKPAYNLSSSATLCAFEIYLGLVN